jgi:hypothetical protein
MKEEMGCLTGKAAVMFPTSMVEEIARTEPSRCSRAASRIAEAPLAGVDQQHRAPSAV